MPGSIFDDPLHPLALRRAQAAEGDAVSAPVLRHPAPAAPPAPAPAAPDARPPVAASPPAVPRPPTPPPTPVVPDQPRHPARTPPARRARPSEAARRRRTRLAPAAAGLVGLILLIVVLIRVLAPSPHTTLAASGAQRNNKLAAVRPKQSAAALRAARVRATWAAAGSRALFPFAPSVLERPAVPADALPAYSDDGRPCATGCRPAGAIAGWPLKPFHTQHALRAGFDERRVSGFHVGIDIQAADHSPVYAVQPGTADIVAATGVDARVKVGNYIYWHVHPLVKQGQTVVPYKTVVGFVIKGAGHLHFSEVDATGQYLNPLRPGGRVLSPYRDTVPPVLAAPKIASDGSVTERAFDPQSFHLKTTYDTPVLAPAAMAYAVFDVDGTRTGPLQWAFRFTHLVPNYAEPLIFARGAHSAGWTCFATTVVCKPDWRFRLAGGLTPVLTGLGLPRGRYRLTTYAWDFAGNVAARDTPFALTGSGTAAAV